MRALDLVVQQLASHAYAWSTEAELQDGIRETLLSRFDHVQSEVVLSRRDRPDFVVDVAGAVIAIEVKVAGARNEILRQLGRYAEHDTVDGLVLASARRTLLWALPESIHGKPLAGALVAGPL